MEFLTIILIAFALAMDAFAVSVISGSVYRQFHVKHFLRMAFSFGLFQAVMPLIGELAGLKIKDYISNYDHWVAFGILTLVGGKMIYESFKIKTVQENFDPSRLLVILLLSIATSIDALAVGITLTLIKVPLAIAVTIIGIITFALSYAGTILGKKFGHFFESKIEILGGLILICLGFKILLQHLF